MRRLVPDVADLPLEDTYADLALPLPPTGSDRATVSLGMVAAADGAASVEGTSGGLGGAADRRAFRRLRDACDVILVGAGTVRAEDYGPPRSSPERAAARRSAGLRPAPLLVVVTARVDLDPSARLFSADRDPHVPRPVVVTSSAAPEARVAALASVAEVWRLGASAVDLAGLLRRCAAEGLPRVLCEGGPALNGALLAADLVDELFLTVAPRLVGGEADRIVTGTRAGVRDLDLLALHEHEGELLLRYRVRARSSGRRDGC